MFKVGDLVRSNAFSDEKHYGIITKITTDDVTLPFNGDYPRTIYYIKWFQDNVAPDYVYDIEIKLAY